MAYNDTQHNAIGQHLHSNKYTLDYFNFIDQRLSSANKRSIPLATSSLPPVHCPSLKERQLFSADEVKSLQDTIPQDDDPNPINQRR